MQRVVVVMVVCGRGGGHEGMMGSTCVPEAVFSNELELLVQSLLLEGTAHRLVDLAVVGQVCCGSW